MNSADKPSSLAALVTGGSRGIGRVIAMQLAERGVRVAVHYRDNRSAAEDTLAQLSGTGHALFAADLADPAAAAHLWQQVIERQGSVDILINNAGIYLTHAPLSTDYKSWQSAWRRTIATNLSAPANLSLLAAQTMASRIGPVNANFGRGRIVNISSRGAFRGEPEAPAYGASKAGLNALSQSLAKALAPSGVLAYCLPPGWVETEMAAEFLAGPRGGEIRGQHPLGRVTLADEIARVAVFCALDAPAAMTGAVIDVNGASYLRT